MPRTMLAAALASVALLSTTVIIGCESTGNGSSSSAGDIMANIQQRIAGEWKLDALNGQSIADLLQGEGVRGAPTMSIADNGQVGGFAGVNRYFSQLDLSRLAKGDFSLGPAGSTMMAGSDDAMKLENNFLAALNDVRKLDASALSDGVLRLLADNGEELLKFIR